MTTEASINSEADKRRLVIYEFDTRAKRYTNRTFVYAKDSSNFITGDDNNATNIFVMGDMTHLAGDRYIMIERDDFQGPPTGASPPRQKKLYLFDLGEIDRATGALRKELLVDLLRIDDPEDIGGPLAGIPGRLFNFPGQSIESVTPIGNRTLLVGLDNNYPGGNGRVPGTPDGTEIITLRSKAPLSDAACHLMQWPRRSRSAEWRSRLPLNEARPVSPFHILRPGDTDDTTRSVTRMRQHGCICDSRFRQLWPTRGAAS